MRVVIQRVSQAQVVVEGEIKGAIEQGLLLFLGIEASDTLEDVEKLSQKIVQLRIFNDEAGLMNRSVQDIGGNCLLISQFTLHAQTRKGNRPSFIRAARPEQAIPLYEAFGQALEQRLGKSIAKGVFGADMKVSLLNDGPVTILIDSQNWE